MFPIALKDEEIQIYYQPKINVENSTIVGAEALSRWYHDGNLVMPGDFIPILEKTTDICKLDFYVLEHVCRDIRRWLDEGLEVVRVSVNLSRRHLIEDDLLDRILDIIDMYDVPHKYIEIELTETATLGEFKDLKRIVSSFQDVGLSASVDDFGIGYSSLNLLREIPWNVIKVDKNFVPLDTEDKESTRNIMFKNVVNMVREMGLVCVAEGVETEEQVQILKDNGCFVAQGFYYDKPLPAQAFKERLAHRVYQDQANSQKN